MREAEKLESLWFALPAFASVPLRMTAKAKQPRFIGVYFEPELLESYLESGSKPSRIVFILEAQHKVVRISHDNNFPARLMLPPVLYPLVKDIVEVNVRK